ncbi:hypothetical protein [uncultured Winogradskyella sp.]|uniref:hypothetical protein n=1 Tax=uncultured Winogradskyella sp. TaxID=395353 RepID=UPI002622C78F|nr:hypothetical protein [uncultured Winogradskyella sp.]
MNKLITKEHLLFLVVGGFSILLTSELANFIGQIINQFLIFINQDPLLVIIVKEVVQLAVFIISVHVILKLITKQKVLIKDNLIKLIVWLIGIYFVIQVLQVLYGIYGISSLEGYREATINYSEYVKENYLIISISSVVYYLQRLLFAISIVNYTLKDD